MERRARAVARLGPLEHELAQVAVLVVALRHRERRQHRVVELDLDVGALGDPERVVAGLRQLGEQRAHLDRRLDVELVAVELEAVRVALQRTGLHAQQGVVRVGIVLVGVVRVVRGEQRRAEPPGDVEQRPDRRRLLGDAVVLELHEEVVAPEDVLEAAGRLVRGIVLPREQQLAHQTAETAGGGDDALVVALQEIPVGAGLVVVAVEVGLARDLDEVVVAGVVLGEHREVVDLVLGAARAVEARAVGEVALHAEHRLHALLAGRLEQLEDAVHVAVVGDAHGGHPVAHGGCDHVVDARRTIEHRVLGVEVQMDERVSHTGVASRTNGPLSTGTVDTVVDESHGCHSAPRR